MGCAPIFGSRMKRPLQDVTNTISNKNSKKNSPTNHDDISQWPIEVLKLFQSKLKYNKTSKNSSYTTAQAIDENQPPELQKSVCVYPTKSNQLMVVYEGQQYQRPIHRLVLQLDRYSKGLNFLSKTEQASHLCMDSVNLDGKGNTHFRAQK